jgi:hypothetical protein
VTDSLPETYEQLKAWIAALPSPFSDNDRTLGFADESHSIALSRNAKGQVEVFLVGDQVKPTFRAVARSLVFQEWHTSNEGVLRANQIALPNDPSFNAAAAVVCVELIDADYALRPQAAFAQVEPLIDRLITGVDQIGDQVLIGLIGELAVLDALTRSAVPHRIDDVLASWEGYRPSSRDFQLDVIGVEVKTTTGPSSIHRIQGFHQLELGYSVAGVPEAALYLLSLGVRLVPGTSHAGVSVASLVDRVLEQITAPATREDFLARVQQYGGDSGVGYDHNRDRNKPRFQARYSLMFERLYDLSDENLHILSRSDVESFTNVDSNSIEFRLYLPAQVTGELNPISDMSAIASTLLGRSLPE